VKRWSNATGIWLALSVNEFKKSKEWIKKTLVQRVTENVKYSVYMWS